MSYIYIGGDSFCKYRGDQDWPKQLADLFGYQIIGRGFEGASWWHTRQELQSYTQHQEFHKIELFVICHTCSQRILTNNCVLQNRTDQIDHAREIYYKYIHDCQVNNWATQNWYRELNTWLANKRVIHVQLFESTKDYFNILNGLKFVHPLTPISLEEIKHNPGLFMREHIVDSGIARRNHFTVESNKKLAKFIYDKYCFAITYNEEITDNFQFHPGV